MPSFVIPHSLTRTFARFVRNLVIFHDPFSAPKICVPCPIEVIPYVLGAYVAECFISSSLAFPASTYSPSGAGFSCLAVLPLPLQVLTAGMLAS